eukprot:scaffold23964_cov153-Amphora_coffeaeformis.AAC.2
MGENFSNAEKPKVAALSMHQSLLGSVNAHEGNSSSSESVPSVATESDESFSASSVHEPEPGTLSNHENLESSVGIDKDLLIRNLRLELDDMKEQERILREEIAGVVDLAKEHEQMVGEEYEDRIQAYEEEVVNLKRCLQESDIEKERLSKELESLRLEHAKQMEDFQKDARAAQESHKEYIQKVSFVLDEANEARRRETARILTELDSVKQTKEAEIKKLKSEVHFFRTSINGLTQRGQSPRAGARDQEDRNAELQQLRKAIMAAIKPERVVTVVERAQRRPWSKEAFIDEKVSLRVGQYVARLVELASSPEAG